MTYPSVRQTRMLLLLSVPIGILLLTCTVAAWALPHLGTDGGCSPQSDRCVRISGPAQNLCRTAPAGKQATVHGAPAPAASPNVLNNQQMWLLVFSGATFAGAIGLAVMAGRRI